MAPCRAVELYRSWRELLGAAEIGLTLSEEDQIDISTPADPETGSEASDGTLAMRHTRLEMTVSGEPGAG